MHPQPGQTGDHRQEAHSLLIGPATHGDVRHAFEFTNPATRIDGDELATQLDHTGSVLILPEGLRDTLEEATHGSLGHDPRVHLDTLLSPGDRRGNRVLSGGLEQFRAQALCGIGQAGSL